MRLYCTALVAWLSGLVLSGCDLAPVYVQPHFLLPDTYQGNGTFHLAEPDAVLSPNGQWWTLFNDPVLDKLEEALVKANPTLQGAMEQYTQARDLAAEAQSQFYPQLGAGGRLSNNRQSVDRLFRGSTTTANVEASNEVVASASWEPDFWDQIRNLAHEKKRLAQASAADLVTARLSLQAELATDYLAVRGLDQELEVLRQAIDAYQKAVDVTQLRYHGGIASGLDLARASSQLGSAQAQLSETVLQRDLLQHAVAVLVGAIPSSFSLPAAVDFRPVPPPVPVGVPSELLQRRPDIASAERQMAAANASIGVSRAAFYPHVTFLGTAGFQANGFNLFDLPDSFWSIGADAMLPLFQGGLRRAELQQSWSQYAQTRDTYRATVLAAFQEVEDGLSLTQRLKSEVTQQHEASDQAAQALSISTTLYNAGLDNYLSVAVAQVQALTAHTSEVQVQVRQMQAAVALIRALGGGWMTQALPNERQTLPFGPLNYHVPEDTDAGLH
jgi:NodT family efflux transporter outer membrane factor (OMF) lipoprotein